MYARNARYRLLLETELNRVVSCRGRYFLKGMKAIPCMHVPCGVLLALASSSSSSSSSLNTRAEKAHCNEALLDWPS